ncbi:MAG: hypothetical protein ACJ8BW_00955 [Ktedonobacteraceae bacterium]
MTFNLTSKAVSIAHNRELVEREMERRASELGIPNDGWYISERKNRNGVVEYEGDWTKKGLLILLHKDERGRPSIEQGIKVSALDNKGWAVGWCGITWQDHRYSSTGRCHTSEMRDSPGLADDVAETRAMKRAAILATGGELLSTESENDELNVTITEVTGHGPDGRHDDQTS